MPTAWTIRPTDGFHVQNRVQGHHISRSFGRLAAFFRFFPFSTTRRLSSVLLPPRECGQRWSMWCFFGSYLSPVSSAYGFVTARLVAFGMYRDRLVACHRRKNKKAMTPEMHSDGFGSSYTRKAVKTASDTQKTMPALTRLRRKSLTPSLARRSALSQ